MIWGKYIKDHINSSGVQENIKCKMQKCKCEYMKCKNFLKYKC